MYTIGKRGSDADFRTEQAVLRAAGAEVAWVPRGGETTWHGPGQLVVYPIVSLRELRVGPRAYVEGLEDAMVAALGEWGIVARVRAAAAAGAAADPAPVGPLRNREACLQRRLAASSFQPPASPPYAPCPQGRVPGKTGVWVGERKIGAVGVRISHGVTRHGLALNVRPDLSAYAHIVPCGSPDKEVTSIAREVAEIRYSSANSGGGGGGDAKEVSLEAAAAAIRRAFMRQFGYAEASWADDVLGMCAAAGIPTTAAAAAGLPGR